MYMKRFLFVSPTNRFDSLQKYKQKLKQKTQKKGLKELPHEWRRVYRQGTRPLQNRISCHHTYIRNSYSLPCVSRIEPILSTPPFLTRASVGGTNKLHVSSFPVSQTLLFVPMKKFHFL
jgi:hypothetical protein